MTVFYSISRSFSRQKSVIFTPVKHRYKTFWSLLRRGYNRYPIILVCVCVLHANFRCVCDMYSTFSERYYCICAKMMCQPYGAHWYTLRVYSIHTHTHTLYPMLCYIVHQRTVMRPILYLRYRQHMCQPKYPNFFSYWYTNGCSNQYHCTSVKQITNGCVNSLSYHYSDIKYTYTCNVHYGCNGNMWFFYVCGFWYKNTLK